MGKLTQSGGVVCALLSIPAILGGLVAGRASAEASPAGAPAPRSVGRIARMQQAREPAELFQRQCVACHGKKGRGDGPAAIALTPRPKDLTDKETMDQLSDEELLEVLTKGRGAMPGFGAILTPDELRAMAEYVRQLSGP